LNKNKSLIQVGIKNSFFVLELSLETVFKYIKDPQGGFKSVCVLVMYLFLSTFPLLRTASDCQWKCPRDLHIPQFLSFPESRHWYFRESWDMNDLAAYFKLFVVIFRISCTLHRNRTNSKKENRRSIVNYITYHSLIFKLAKRAPKKCSIQSRTFVTKCIVFIT
jgi:hypothetical protein